MALPNKKPALKKAGFFMPGFSATLCCSSQAEPGTMPHTLQYRPLLIDALISAS
ncbi:hypothetical protein ACM1PE_21350 [Achromobacter sp. PD1]|uniref:hypothetical protein n=1 Tax=Achromobacter sp. PD1 TaxID=3399125 RepID=UPI000B20F5B1